MMNNQNSLEGLQRALKDFSEEITRITGVPSGLEDIQFVDARPSTHEQADLIAESVKSGTISPEQAEKALKKLRSRKLSKFRTIKALKKVRIGDTVRTANGFPMQVTGIFQDFPNEERGTLYLDFDGNEGDVWEEAIGDVEWCGSWISVLWKKLVL